MDIKFFILLAVVAYFILRSNTSSRFTNTGIYDISNQNYNTPNSCNFNVEYRTNPSGHLPASYLGLSQQEKDTLLLSFVNNKDNLTTDELVMDFTDK